MNHQHLPALNRYTSPHQYAALQEIQKSKSLTALLMKGQMSKTVGSLIRSAWITPITYTDDAGVVREGWTVSDAGHHAMKIYDAKLEEQRKVEEAIAKRKAEKNAQEAELFNESLIFFRSQIALKKQELKVNLMAADMWRNDAQRVFKMAHERAQYEAEQAESTE